MYRMKLTEAAFVFAATFAVAVTFAITAACDSGMPKQDEAVAQDKSGSSLRR